MGTSLLQIYKNSQGTNLLCKVQSLSPIPGKGPFWLRLTLIRNNFLPTKPIKLQLSFFFLKFYLELLYKNLFFVITTILKLCHFEG